MRILYLILVIFSVWKSVLAMASEEYVVERESETAAPLASALASQIVPKLKADKLDVVFLDIVECDATEKISKDSKNKQEEARIWCENFSVSLESSFLKSGIKFLPGALRDEIRNNLAEESLYQHGSLNVDTEKAEKLGKQKAFQAFVSVSIKRISVNSYRVTASVLNISQAIIAHRETIFLNQRVTVDTWAGIIGGTLSVAGLGAGLYYQLLSDKYHLSSKDHEEKASNAKTSSEKKSETNLANSDEDKSQSYRPFVNGGWILLGCGLLYLWSNLEFHFRIQTVNSDQYRIESKTNRITFIPMIDTKTVGFGLNYDF